MIDEDAGELIADRLVDQQRGDGRVDPAGEPADHAARRPTCARMRATSVARNCAMVQSPAQPAIAMHEIGDERRAVRRVHHLGMELHAVELAGIVGDGRERRAVRHADGAEAGRQPA